MGNICQLATILATPWYLYMQDNLTHFAGFCRTIPHGSATRRLILRQIFIEVELSDSCSTMAATCLLTPWAMVLNF